MGSVRVLIVDDEPQFVDAVAERLRLRGFDADALTSGRHALERLGEKAYDVLVLDVKMPGLGGLEVIRQVRERWPGLQVILLTGHGSSKDAESGVQLGAFRYLMKPVAIEDLAQIIRQASALNAEGSG